MAIPGVGGEPVFRGKNEHIYSTLKNGWLEDPYHPCCLIFMVYVGKYTYHTWMLWKMMYTFPETSTANFAPEDEMSFLGRLGLF